MVCHAAVTRARNLTRQKFCKAPSFYRDPVRRGKDENWDQRKKGTKNTGGSISGKEKTNLEKMTHR